MFKHPNYYKNLRKLYRSRNRDQAISLQASTEDARRAPGTGLQQGIEETVPHNDIEEATSSQASSDKRQAPSNKRQASSRKRQAL